MVQYNKNVHIQGKEVTGQLLYYLYPHHAFFYTLQNIINIEKQLIQMYNFIVFGLTRSGSTHDLPHSMRFKKIVFNLL